MLFKDIPGQEPIKKRLIRSALHNRISHAQIFSGGEGTMKLPMALAYAQFICCTDKNIIDKEELQADSCGTCPSCLKYKNLAHPDLHFIFPTISLGSGTQKISDNFMEPWREMWRETGGFFNFQTWLLKIQAENKQPIISVEEVNQIIKKLSYRAYESEYKAMILWLPEKMYHTASPRILKILEEPPQKTLFVLVSEDTTTILSTILSRTQELKFPRIPRSEVSKWLISKNIDKEVANRAAFLSEGNVVKALELTNETNAIHFERLRTWLRLCFKPRQSMGEIVAFSEELAAMGREAQKEFLAYSLKVLRQSYYAGQTGTAPLYRNEESDFINNFMPFVHQKNIESYNTLFVDGIAHIERNGNPKIIFLDMALKLAKLLRQ